MRLFTIKNLASMVRCDTGFFECFLLSHSVPGGLISNRSFPSFNAKTQNYLQGRFCSGNMFLRLVSRVV